MLQLLQVYPAKVADISRCASHSQPPVAYRAERGLLDALDRFVYFFSFQPSCVYQILIEPSSEPAVGKVGNRPREIDVPRQHASSLQRYQYNINEENVDMRKKILFSSATPNWPTHVSRFVRTPHSTPSTIYYPHISAYS